MAINIQEMANVAKVNLCQNGKSVSESDVDKYIQVLNPIRSLTDDEFLSEEQLKLLAATIKSQISVTITRTDKVLTNPDFESWFYKDKINHDMYYWNRYREYLKYDKHFTTNVIDNIDNVLDQLTDYLGNPNLNHPFQRRGLIIGDVQSGKTSNFIGLMCKASDVGYKLIVVLASTTDKLRTQTQLRVDEGFIGNDSENLLKHKYERIGAANYGNGKEDKRPVCVTSTVNDFNRTIANSMGLQLNQTKESIVFVIKKNVSVLNNLNKWIKGLNQADSSGKINQSLLVIDDEADYASINTNSEDKDPTKTNAKIQELLSAFTRASYVGFTATPYANVFIDPETTEEMTEAPLFPKDYIYCLDAPSNYIGARNLFGENEIDPSIKTITYDENDENCIYNILPLKHKKDAKIDKLPNTLKQAIREFFIGNVIRDLRGALTSHRSMIINISRFVMVHEETRKAVDDYVSSLKRSIVFYSKKDDDSWKKDSNMIALYDTYMSDFSPSCENKQFANQHGYKLTNWNEIMKNLHDSTFSIIVRVVNQQSKDDMNYEKNKNSGLRVIAIGGISLSRGLTLEGLMVSYFYRSTNTYDTLMQMGRWFGYREGYRDLCKIWMTDDAQECYVSTNRATEELRSLILQYKYSNLTPLDFGIQVRTDNNMLITARNKMRSAKQELIECTLNSKVVETKYLLSNKNDLQNNSDVTYDFIQKLINNYEIHYDKEISTAKGFKNVRYEEILEYLDNLNISIANIEFENEALKKFVKDNSHKLSKWDVALIQGDKEQDDKLAKNIILRRPNRQIDIKPSTELIRVSKKRCRVGGPSDGKFGLTLEQINKIKNIRQGHNVSQTDYFGYFSERNPLLCIYLIKPFTKKDEDITDKRYKYAQNICDYLNNESIPLVAISLGFPNLGKECTTVKYALNKVAQGLKQIGIEDGEYKDENDQ